MKRVNYFDVLDDIEAKAPMKTPIDVSDMESCNEIMKLSIEDIFPSWLKTLRDDTAVFYPRVFKDCISFGGIVNKTPGGPVFTVEELNARDHHEVEFMITTLKVKSFKQYAYFYRNLCTYLFKITRGLFSNFRSRLSL